MWWFVQHLTLAMLKELLFTLDLAADTGTAADRAAANRLQRKSDSWPVPLRACQHITGMPATHSISAADLPIVRAQVYEVHIKTWQTFKHIVSSPAGQYVIDGYV